VADLSDRLPFADGTFDDVVASLVLHYLEDWGPTLAEMRRVLRPGGRLIASVQHPFVDYAIQNPRPNYFATTSYAEEWTFNGRSFPMIFWRRPYAAGPAPLASDTNDLRRLAAVQFGPFLQPRRDCGVVDPWRAGTARQEAAVRGWMGRWTIS
jgi:SAM-dependent methyltransferase